MKGTSDRMDFRIREVYVRWIGIFLLTLLTSFFGPKDPRAADWSPLKFYLVVFGFNTIYWNGAVFIFMHFRRVFPEFSQTIKKLLITYLLMFLWMSIGGLPLKMALGFVEYSWVGIYQACTDSYLLSFILAIIIGTAYETVYFFERWKESILQNEELKNRQIRTQFEVLQNQMSPHFLFNSLNTLTTLIAENQELAIDFTQKLSEVYRYILQTKDRELVSLHEELEFAKSYLYLLKMRFPDNLTATFKVDDSYDQMSIAPLTIQMLIENAIKHNVVSKAHPLHIEVYVDNGKSIIVKNNLQLKPVIEKSTRTGLENIRKRYEYLGHKQIDVITSAKNYMVAIPLIDLIEDKHITQLAV